MRVLVMSELAKKIADLDVSAVPRAGDVVDMFYRPAPTVKKVVWWPRQDTLEAMEFLPGENVTAIVFLE